jgi:hypothetical protein
MCIHCLAMGCVMLTCLLVVAQWCHVTISILHTWYRLTSVVNEFRPFKDYQLLYNLQFHCKHHNKSLTMDFLNVLIFTRDLRFQLQSILTAFSFWGSLYDNVSTSDYKISNDRLWWIRNWKGFGRKWPQPIKELRRTMRNLIPDTQL